MGLCEPPAPCSGFCFFLLPSGMLLQLCLQLGRCHLTGPTGPRSREHCLSLFHKKQNPLSEGETGNSARGVPLSHFRKPSFSPLGEETPYTLHSCQRSESTSGLGQGSSLLERHGNSNHGRRYWPVLLGRSQSEWRGDPQITRRFLDFFKGRF